MQIFINVANKTVKISYFTKSLVYSCMGSFGAATGIHVLQHPKQCRPSLEMCLSGNPGAHLSQVGGLVFGTFVL